MSNRRCPRCQTAYAAPARFCVKDGSLLIESDPQPADKVPAPDASVRPAREIAPVEPASPELVLPSLASLTGQVLDQRYRIARKLGEGGMSYVYQAQEVDTGRSVAVKILIPRLSRDPASVERLRREATIATRLNHPNVCPILRLGQTSDRLIYLVMPFLEGEPLSEHETRRGPFPLSDGIPLLVQMCHGLGHAHDLQIIHRDLKPENVMLVPDPEMPNGLRGVVMDFGLAKERRAGPDVVKLTATGIVLGTPEFMSPEQIRGKPLDARSDIYALAVLAFELFTGQLPFAGKSAQETMIARLRGAPLPLRAVKPDLPAKLEAVITKSLAVNPAERYGSMAELAHAFESTVSTGMLGRLFKR
ncbi:MAG TPA: serine/threonine-protein kinase [Gemmatimonadales bacterium]|nr:serine/threonine-protein kinase [Gemmatimonadales bacterium]